MRENENADKELGNKDIFEILSSDIQNAFKHI